MTKKTDGPAITKLSDKREEVFIETGIAELDEILGGGIYRGRITELWGQEGVGKTYIVSKIMANLSKDYSVLYIDSEYALNKDRVTELGANPDNIQYVADSHLERVTELMIDNVGKYDVIILDSLAYLTPLTIDENEVGTTAIGLFARLVKNWVVKFRPRLGVSKTAFVAINQYRAPIGLYAKAEAPGGKAWHHAVDVRVLLSTNSADKIMAAGSRVGHWVHAETKKNKLAPPYQTAKFKLMYKGF